MVLRVACVAGYLCGLGGGGGIELEGKKTVPVKETGHLSWEPIAWGRGVWTESSRYEAHLGWSPKYILHCFWATDPKIFNFVGKKHVPSRRMKFLTT